MLYIYICIYRGACWLPVWNGCTLSIWHVGMLAEHWPGTGKVHPALDILKWWLLWASVGRPKWGPPLTLKSHGWNLMFPIETNGTGRIECKCPIWGKATGPWTSCLSDISLHFLDHFQLEPSESCALGAVSLHAPEWFLGLRPSDLQQSVLFASNWQMYNQTSGKSSVNRDFDRNNVYKCRFFPLSYLILQVSGLLHPRLGCSSCQWGLQLACGTCCFLTDVICGAGQSWSWGVLF